MCSSILQCITTLLFILIFLLLSFFFFFFNDTATTEIYTLSLHDALPISLEYIDRALALVAQRALALPGHVLRSEEHTSELQSHSDLVCRLLLEKKKKKNECCTKPIHIQTTDCNVTIITYCA